MCPENRLQAPRALPRDAWQAGSGGADLPQLSEQLRGLSQLGLCGGAEVPLQLVWKDSLLASFLGISGSITTPD